MTRPRITLCRLCEGADPGLDAAIAEALQNAGIDADVAGADCMSGCARAPTLAIRQTGKTAYLFGEIGQGDIPDLMRFLTLYAAAPDGHLEDARPIGGLRFKALARIPG